MENQRMESKKPHKSTIRLKLKVAQSAGAVEYTDCTSAEG